MKAVPRVSIGLPIYNAEKLVSRALDALLSQTFSDFELIISDNASTDGTWAICEAYAQRDNRIRLYKNESNIGVVRNFQRVLDLAQGDYYMWAAHDDVWDSDYLSVCIEGLDTHPEAILAFTGIRVIREYIQSDSILSLQFHNQSSEPWKRALDLLRHPEPKNSIFYGVYRRNLLERAGSVPHGLGADIIWLLKCALEGTFVQLDPVLFTTYIDKRPIRSRLRQHTGGTRVHVLTLLRLEWTFIIQLFRLTQSAAPHLSARLQLLGVSARVIWQKLGWPLSPRLLIRYGTLLLPESWFPAE